MKRSNLSLVLIASFTLASAALAADTPAEIAADYRAKAATALARANKTLEQEANTIASTLLKAGDSAGAQAVAAQVKQKEAGDAVADPHPSAAVLFTKYDEARTRLLVPVQQASIARIDALLKMAGGQKPETVAGLARTRDEISSGKVSDPISQKWTYHVSPDAAPIASMELSPDGTFTLLITAKGKKEIGTWQPSGKTNVVTLSYGGSTWDMIVDGRKASMNRPDSGMRYLKAVGTTNL